MANPYFTYFPKVEYQSKIVTDITRRFKLDDNLKSDPYLFIPYTISDDIKAEDVALFYYGDQDLVWLIYIANNIVDPYSQWPMTSKNLFKSLQKKYYKKILDVSEVIDGKIYQDHSYKTSDPVIVYGNNAGPLVKGRVYYVIVNPNNSFSLSSTIIGALSGQSITFSDDTPFKLVFDVNRFIYNGEITSNIIVARNTENPEIEASPETYFEKPNDWYPVRVFEYENEQNDKKRIIWLINDAYKTRIIEEFKKIYNG